RLAVGHFGVGELAITQRAARDQRQLAVDALGERGIGDREALWRAAERRVQRGALHALLALVGRRLPGRLVAVARERLVDRRADLGSALDVVADEGSVGAQLVLFLERRTTAVVLE